MAYATLKDMKTDTRYGKNAINDALDEDELNTDVVLDEIDEGTSGIPGSIGAFDDWNDYEMTSARLSA